MPGFDGTGPRGMGPMTGGGRGFCAMPMPGNWPAYGRRWNLPYAQSGNIDTRMTREQEFGFLKAQAEALKEQLEQIATRIKEMEEEGE